MAKIRSTNFVERAKERIDRMKQAAAELTEELGLPQEAKYDLLSTIYNQGLTPSGVTDDTERDEEAMLSLRQPLSPGSSNKESKVRLAEEEELARRTSQGDSDALSELYERYIDRIYHYFYKRVRSTSEAELLTSAAFTDAVEALVHGQDQRQGEPFGSWLYRIADRVLHERIGDVGHAQLVEELNDLELYKSLSGEANVLDIIVERESQDALWQLVGELPLAERQILEMRHAYHLPYAEIAKRLKYSEAACKQLHYRALTKLKQKVHTSGLWSDIGQGEK